jgi:DNA recombination protein RmuC
MILDTLHIILLVIALAAAAAAFVFSQRKPPDTAHLSAELAERSKEVAGLKSEAATQRQRAEAAEKTEAGVRASLEAGEAKVAELKAASAGLTQQLTKLQGEHAQALADAARTAEREASFAREKEQLQKMQLESEARFKALAEAALLKSQQQFVQIADETLKKHKEGAEGELGKMLKPIQESFGLFREKVDEIQKERAEDRAKLSEQIKTVGESVRQTEMVAGKLATALSSTKGGGRWGEETLRNVLEMAGLSQYADFSEQTSNQTEKGRQRPDVIIRMPGGRELVIDAKVSLDDYLSASEENDPGLRKQKFAAHAARVRSHVTGLSKKEYTKEFSERVDFVAMFIPGENFYAAVLEHDREIFDYAARNNVIIVTPSTLIALAKSVAYGWRQEQMAKNAEQAKKLGQELYERLAKFTEHMGRVGGGLGNAIKAYNDMVGSLESRVLPSAKKLEELQFADPNKVIEEPAPVDIAPRQLTLLDGLSPEPERALAASRSKAGK